MRPKFSSLMYNARPIIPLRSLSKSFLLEIEKMFISIFNISKISKKLYKYLETKEPISSTINLELVTEIKRTA